MSTCERCSIDERCAASLPWCGEGRSTLSRWPRSQQRRTKENYIFLSLFHRSSHAQQQHGCRTTCRPPSAACAACCELPPGPLFGGGHFGSSAANIRANRTRFWPQPVRPTPPVFPCPRGGSKPARGRAAGISFPPCASAAPQIWRRGLEEEVVLAPRRARARRVRVLHHTDRLELARRLPVVYSTRFSILSASTARICLARGRGSPSTRPARR